MEAMRTAVLLALSFVAVGYALWVAVYFMRGQRSRKRSAAPLPAPEPRRSIVGKSRFTLPERSQPTPTAAIGSGSAKSGEKDDIFVPGSVQKHPRQIPPEKLDEVFGVPPEGESNDPDDEDCPLTEASDYEAEIEADMDADDENEDESQPPAGRSLAKGVRFENIGEAYRTVVHDNPLTNEKQQEVGQTLLELKRTDMFEAIVSACPDGNDKVKSLIDAYLTAFQKKIAASSAGSPSPQAPVPEGFDVRDFV